MRRIVGLCLVLAFLLLSPLRVLAAPKIVYRAAGSTGRLRVALTFDDGPHPRYTREILDILKEYGVRATFFAVGENAKAYPALVRREVAEGHEVGNHTFHHYHVKKLQKNTLLEEISACKKTLEGITGKEVRLFRPPEGVCSEDLKSICDEENITIVLWSVDTRDWAHTPISEICRGVKCNVQDGAIILMHDFIGKNSPTPKALRCLIPMLLELGYEFVTVSEIIKQ